MLLHERLRALREEMDISQKELAARINVGRSTVSGYERGDKTPSFAVLIQLADLYGVSLDYLFGRTELRASLRRMEGKLTYKSGAVPIDTLFQLTEEEKEIVAQLLAYMANRKA